MTLAGTPSRGRGPVWGELTRAQGGQTISNLARAFHLPRPQAKTAILEMLAPLTHHLDQQTLSRGALARLIELLGKNDYEAVLATPMLIGATSTQVIGNDALTALAGRDESSRIASDAAAAAGISEMIAEYLLPVVAALFMGALSARTRASLSALARNDDIAAALSVEASVPAPQLPVGRGSSGVFAGATVIGTESGKREALYGELAERIRNGGKTPGEPDPLNAARYIMAEGLGVRTRHAPWLARLQQRAVASLQHARAMAQRRLSVLRRRLHGKD
jgi:hypothetical protein